MSVTELLLGGTLCRVESGPRHRPEGVGSYRSGQRPSRFSRDDDTDTTPSRPLPSRRCGSTTRRGGTRRATRRRPSARGAAVARGGTGTPVAWSRTTTRDSGWSREVRTRGALTTSSVVPRIYISQRRNLHLTWSCARVLVCPRTTVATRRANAALGSRGRTRTTKTSRWRWRRAYHSCVLRRGRGG